jgi:hypothetical protein
VTLAVLGFDASPSKLGAGAVYDHDGSPALADVFPLDGSPEAMRDALRDVEVALDAAHAEPSLAYIEEPFGGTGDARVVMQTGEALGMLTYALRARWPGLVIDRIHTARWRRMVGVGRAPEGLSGSARRKWLKEAAVERALRLGWELPTVGKRPPRPSDDAAEAALIARAAWLDLEAGVRAERLPA